MRLVIYTYIHTFCIHVNPCSGMLAVTTCLMTKFSLQVMHVLGFDPHAFAHFRDERKRRRSQVVAL